MSDNKILFKISRKFSWQSFVAIPTPFQRSLYLQECSSIQKQKPIAWFTNNSSAMFNFELILTTAHLSDNFPIHNLKIFGSLSYTWPDVTSSNQKCILLYPLKNQDDPSAAYLTFFLLQWRGFSIHCSVVFFITSDAM